MFKLISTIIPITCISMALCKYDIEKNKLLKSIYIVCMVLSFFIIALTITSVSKEYFNFIPNSWGGYSEEGDYTSGGDETAMIAGMVISGIFLYFTEHYRSTMVATEKKEMVEQKW